MMSPSLVPFGFRDVTKEEKPSLVDSVFSDVAHRYGLMNDVMALGMHRIWKTILCGRIRLSSPIPPSPLHVLDLACGDGDIGMRVARAGDGRHVTLCDVNIAMLHEGYKKASSRHRSVTWVNASADALPFRREYFHCVTIGFGLRNMADYRDVLREIYRCLKKGGQLLALELSAVRAACLEDVYRWYVFRHVPAMGRLVAGREAAYRYLAESIERFDSPACVRASMEEVGFVRATACPMGMGVVHLYEGWKEE
ncbi:MAG: ubiquinone/menaquinone biosynthesis methyltransferase [Alphaproteobacteria bacterium GM7ARS4]|nr:ubiquinone/menaquinone biosynthesis methyltransferase [Alphaproteobacteria bacterium GM7ARS4]